MRPFRFSAKHFLAILLLATTLVALGYTLSRPDPSPADMLRLVKAYPAHLSGFAGNYILWKDGTKMLYDDGLIKTEDETFDNPDLEDQLCGLTYTPGLPTDTPTYNCDPGTFRNQAFFQKMYGSSETEVRRHLTTIWWPTQAGGQKMLVTTLHGVDRRLKAIGKELAARPHLKKYITNIGGTFNWRVIQGTTRQSPHSYGIAIDINTRNAEYWKWDHREDWQLDSIEMNLRWHNSVPLEIVEVFERYGFIWGGKWYHYDTMHFEYRPELVKPQR